MTEPRKSRLPGCMLIGSISMGVLGLIGFLAFEYIASAGRKKVEARLAEIRADGYPTSAFDADQFYSVPPGQVDVTELWLTAILDLAKLTEDHGKHVPCVGESGFDELPLVGEWDQLEVSREYLAEANSSLEKLHHAATQVGLARYPVDLSQGIMATLEHAQHARNAARVLQLQAAVAVHDNDPDAVCRAICTISKLGESLQNEPLLVSQLVRIAVGSQSAIVALKTIPVVEFEQRHYDQILRHVQSPDYLTGLKHGFIGERGTMLDLFLKPGEYASQLEDVANPGAFRPIGPRSADTLFYLDFCEKIIAATEKPISEALVEVQQISDEFDAELMDGSIIGRFKYAISRNIVPAVAPCFVAAARAQATASMVETTIAIRKYRDQNGELPASLKDLVPDYLESVPIDPYDNNPIRYKIVGNETRLHLAGTDRRDDGGAVSDDDEPSVISVEEDVVFRIAWPDAQESVANEAAVTE